MSVNFSYKRGFSSIQVTWLLSMTLCLMRATGVLAAQVPQVVLTVPTVGTVVQSVETDYSRRAGVQNFFEEQTPTPLSGFQPVLSSPTQLPTNPVQITPQDLAVSATRGVLVVLGGMSIVGIYIGIRALFRR